MRVNHSRTLTHKGRTGFAGLLAAALALPAGFAGDASAQGAGWPNVRKVTINTSASGANVTGDVAKFPLSVRLTAANFNFEQAKSDGSDIRFTDATGAKLPYEIEHWDATGKKAMIWVKADVKGNNATQHINLHSGNPSAASESDGKAVFAKEDGWVGVWHMNEAGNTTAGGYKDATANEAHGTGTNLAAANVADCVTGRCPEFLHSAKRSINVGAPKKQLFDIHQKVTFSIWANAKAYDEAYVTHFAKGDKSWRVQMFGIYTWGSHNGRYRAEMCLQTGAGDGHCLDGHPDELKPNTWRLLTVVHDFPAMRFYIDNGVISGSNSGAWRSEDFDVGIGWQSQYKARWFTGNLDEARVLGVAKDANWIKLNFETQKPTGTAITVGEASVGISKAASMAVPAGASLAGSYDLSGRKLETLRPGLVFEKHVAGDGRVVTRKRALLP